MRLRYLIALYKSVWKFCIEHNKCNKHFNDAFSPYPEAKDRRLVIIHRYLFNSLNCIFKAVKLTLFGYAEPINSNNLEKE